MYGNDESGSQISKGLCSRVVVGGGVMLLIEEALNSRYLGGEYGLE